MDILVTGTIEKRRGPSVRINCPLCHAKAADGKSFEQVDHLKLFYVVPLFRLRNTFVKCGACGKQLIAKVSTDEIEKYSANELSDLLIGRVPFVSQFLAVASVALCWAPFVGLVMGIISLIANWRSPGWPKAVSWIGTALSILVSIVVLLILAMG
jgi:hypothetical protein